MRAEVVELRVRADGDSVLGVNGKEFPWDIEFGSIRLDSDGSDRDSALMYPKRTVLIQTERQRKLQEAEAEFDAYPGRIIMPVTGGFDCE